MRSRSGLASPLGGGDFEYGYGRKLMTESMERSERVLVKYPLFKMAVARVQACFDSHDATAEPDCCPIVGESGRGKTTIISYFPSLHSTVYPKVGFQFPCPLAH